MKIKWALLYIIAFSAFNGTCGNEDEESADKSSYDHSKYSNMDHLYHAYTFNSGVGNRECLKVESVSVNLKLKLGEGVKRWVRLSSKEQFWIIGIWNKGFTVINKKKLQNNFHIFQRQIDLDYEVEEVIMFEAPNKLMKVKELIVLVVVDQVGLHNIFWYRIVKNDIEKFWEWPLLKKVTSLNVFNYGDDFNVIITNDLGIHGGSLDLYRVYFNNSLPNIWFLQKIPLQYATNSLSITSVVDVVYVSIVMAQLGIVQIFKYEPFCPETENGKFVHHRYLRSENVTTVNTFFMASRNYLLINGEQGGIYIFSRKGDVLPAFEFDLGLIEDWLIFEVDTYRDDVILIARNSSCITLITWAGSLIGFIVNEPMVQCNEINERHEKIGELSSDLSCLSKVSWKGAVSSNLGDFPVAVIVGDGYSHLYYINCSLNPIRDPESEILRIHYIKNELNKKWQGLKKKYAGYGMKVNNDERPKELEQRNSFEVEETMVVQGLDHSPSWIELEDMAYKISNYVNKIEENLSECEKILYTRNKPFSATVETKKKGDSMDKTGFINSSFTGYLVFEEPLIIERRENEYIKFEPTDDEVSANGILTFIPGYIPKQQTENMHGIKIISGHSVEGSIHDHSVIPSGNSQNYNIISPALTPDFDQLKKSHSNEGTDTLVDILEDKIITDPHSPPHYYLKDRSYID